MLTLELIAHILEFMPLDQRRCVVRVAALQLARDGCQLPPTDRLCLLAADAVTLCRLPFNEALACAELERRGIFNMCPDFNDTACFERWYPKESGLMTFEKWYQTYRGALSQAVIFCTAAHFGRISIMRKFTYRETTCPPRALQFAAENNQADAIKYIFEHCSLGPIWSQWAAIGMACADPRRYEALQMLGQFMKASPGSDAYHSNQSFIRHSIMMAMKNNNEPAFDVLRQLGATHRQIFTEAACEGNTAVVEKMCARFAKRPAVMLQAIEWALPEHVHILMKLIPYVSAQMDDVIKIAAMVVSPEVMQQINTLGQNGCNIALTAAASEFNWPVVIWALDNGANTLSEALDIIINKMWLDKDATEILPILKIIFQTYASPKDHMPKLIMRAAAAPDLKKVEYLVNLWAELH